MIACQRPIEIQETYVNHSHLYAPKTQMKHQQTRSNRPTSIDLPPLHDLSDWSFSPEHTAGPIFEEPTFDNSTLWSRHRYLCFADSERSQLIFSSQIFEGEVACHTSLIKLRRDCKTADLWIQVERQCQHSGAWTESFYSRLPDVDAHIALARSYDDMPPLTRSSSSVTQRHVRRRSALLSGFDISLPTIPEIPRALVY